MIHHKGTENTKKNNRIGYLYTMIAQNGRKVIIFSVKHDNSAEFRVLSAESNASDTPQGMKM
jgi:hypothetical protein